MNATLGKKPSGIYYVDMRGPDGKGSRVSMKTRDLALAKQRAQGYMVALTGKGAAPELDLVGLIAWHADVCLVQSAYNTVKGYKRAAAQFTEWTRARNMTLEKALTSGSMAEFKAHLLRQELHPRTVANAISKLHAIVAKAVANGMLIADPVKVWPRVKIPRSTIEIYSAEQVRAVIAYARNHSLRFAAPMQFLAATGLRRSDVIRFRWEYLAGNRMAFLQHKTGHPIDCALSEMAMSALLECEAQKSGPVWPWLNDSKLDRFCKAAGKALGFTVKTHTFRHTIGVMLAEANAPLPVIQSVLGHSRAITTLVYQHYRPGSEALPLALVSDRLQTVPNECDKTVPITAVSR